MVTMMTYLITLMIFIFNLFQINLIYYGEKTTFGR
jgi:hypothetical protein